MKGNKNGKNTKEQSASPGINPFFNQEHLAGEKVSYGGLNDKRFVNFGLFDVPASPTEKDAEQPGLDGFPQQPLERR